MVTEESATPCSSFSALKSAGCAWGCVWASGRVGAWVCSFVVMRRCDERRLQNCFRHPGLPLLRPSLGRPLAPDVRPVTYTRLARA